MNTQLSKLTTLVFLFFFFFSACTKEPVFQTPIPSTPAAGTGFIRFTSTTDLTGQPYHTSNLMAVISLADSTNTAVLTDKMLTLDLAGGVKTENLKLPAGIYKLTHFRLVYGSVNTHFAAPLVHSAKAALVQKPLAQMFRVAANENAVLDVAVLKVQAGEKPQAFGYPSGAFDNGQSDADPYIKVKMRARMQIGKIVYDSIPASLQLTTWSQSGEMTTSYLGLKAGINEVSLLKNAARYQLQVSKWGTTDEVLLNRDQLEQDTIYTLGASKAAKKLKSEITSRLVNGIYKAESKTEYIYDAAGNLSQIFYYKKRSDNTPYLAATDVFEHRGAQVLAITRFNEQKKAVRITTFGYDAQGRVQQIDEKENGQQTLASVSYANYSLPTTTIHYTYPGQEHTMDYTMSFYGGNMITGNAFTSYRSSEMGRYDYDFGINPYAHLNWPDLFLSHSSQSNITAQYKSYQYNEPAEIPYNYSYTYDEEGYPKEQVKKLRSYKTGEHLYTIKTAYVY